MTTEPLPIGEPVIPASHVPVDEIGRPVITSDQKAQISHALSLTDPGAKAALLVFADLPTKTARANFAWRVGKGWTVGAAPASSGKGRSPRAGSGSRRSGSKR